MNKTGLIESSTINGGMREVFEKNTKLPIRVQKALQILLVNTGKYKKKKNVWEKAKKQTNKQTKYAYIIFYCTQNFVFVCSQE